MKLSDIPLSVRREIKAAVDKGARRLDHRRRNWFLAIDTRKLDLSLTCNCVLGQLYDEHYCWNSLAKVLNNLTGDLFTASGRYGFTIPKAAQKWIDEEARGGSGRYPADRAVWNALDYYWKLEIRARRRALEDSEKLRDAALAA